MLAGSFRPPQDSHLGSVRIQVAQVQDEDFGTGSERTPSTLDTVLMMTALASSKFCVPFKFRSYSHRRISSAVLTVTRVR